MAHILIILSPLDIEPAQNMLARLGPCRVACFDPSLVDDLHMKGVAQAEYLDFPGAPAFPDLHNGAREAALAAERTLFKAAAPALPGVGNFSWLHLNWYYLLIAARWYRALGKYVAAHTVDLFGENKPVLFVNDNPASFFWPSFLPALGVLEELAQRGVDFEAYTYGVRADESDVVPGLFEPDGDRSGQWDLLTHLPTSLHDMDMLNEELRASGRSTINLAAKYWSVELTTGRHLPLGRRGDLRRLLPESTHAAIAAVLEGMAGPLDTLLQPHIPSESYRQRQTAQLLGLYESQLVAYHLLHGFFAGRKPRKMLLSDHDAGFHGPLLAYAEVENIPVLFFPHSKTTADLQFSRATVSCLTHPIQGAPIHDADNLLVASRKLAYPEQLRGSSAMPGALRRIGLLLNSVSLNGVMVTAWEPYMAGVRAIADWCRARGVELTVRSRPGHTLYTQVAAATGIPVDTLHAGMLRPLASFVDGLDLCLMYDAPTTAELELLRNAVPLLNPVPEALAKYEAVIADPAIIPRGPVEEILFRLDGFLADTNSLHAFRLGQFGRYAAAFEDAQALRGFL